MVGFDNLLLSSQFYCEPKPASLPFPSGSLSSSAPVDSGLVCLLPKQMIDFVTHWPFCRPAPPFVFPLCPPHPHSGSGPFRQLDIVVLMEGCNVFLAAWPHGMRTVRSWWRHNDLTTRPADLNSTGSRGLVILLFFCSFCWLYDVTICWYRMLKCIIN